MTSQSRSQDSYYLNFCTFSYSTAYWDWPRWEREIDWMALHGITMPLALTGHEAVLYRVYRDLGMSDLDVRLFLGGPGYLPFQFMGCIDHFGGPLPRSWIEPHRVLGTQILVRERELGMRPVLPGFAGHVPPELGLAGTTIRTWVGAQTHRMNPAASGFPDLAERIAATQRELFGTDHLYAIDPFIEMPPEDLDEDGLGRFATLTIDALTRADPDAVWVLQSWPFSYNAAFWTQPRVDAFLTAVPPGRLIVLDLFAERQPLWRRPEGFDGHRWQWCMLHNFGGNTAVFGDLDGLHTGIEQAFASLNPPAGVGLTMEAVGTNPVMYELATDLAWAPVGDLGRWLHDYHSARYGIDGDGPARAWELLRKTAYGQARNEPVRRVLHQIPTDAGVPKPHPPGYNPAAFERAYRLLDDSARASATPPGPELSTDLIAMAVELATQSLDSLAARIASAFESRDREGFETSAAAFLRALTDLDRALAGRSEWQLGAFVNAALTWAVEPGDRSVLLDNALRILTMWDDNPLGFLSDYTARVWHGLVGDYYGPRWHAWIAGLRDSLASGADVNVPAVRARMTVLANHFLLTPSALDRQS